jgi:predicted Zn-dependent peptidase
MKKSLIGFLLLLTFLQVLKSSDTTKVSKPEPLPEKEFKFPEYQTVTLDNGLKIFIIEDHKQPTVEFRLLVPGGLSVDTLKPGTAEITASLLTKGTKKLNALDIAKKIDGVGASISANVETDFVTVKAYGLKKHLNTILDVYSQVIMTPSFPEGEFNKIIPQIISSIEQEKSDPRTIASKMSRKIIYGEEHPYAVSATEQTVSSVNISDVKKYFSNYFVPNNATLAVIGDVKPNDIIKEIKKRFSNWEKSKNDVTIKLPPVSPLPLGVYFIERPGSVQSTILFVSKAIPYTHRDYDLLELATNVISGGISGRLYKTLREEHSFTYTPYGRLSQNKYFGRYFCGADVKNPVTDTALVVMLNQITSLTKTPPDEQELAKVKTYQAGAYKMSFENSDFVGLLIQNADFYGKPVKDLETYAERIMNFSANSVKSIANQYLNPTKGYIVVVGSPEIKEKLTQFGKIFDFDLDLNPLSGEKAKMEEVNLTAEELIEKYINAIGGRTAISNIQTIIDTAQVEMIYSTGPIKGQLIQFQKAPDKKYMIFDMDMFKQETWVNGQDVWIKLEKTEKLNSNEAEKLISDAQMFRYSKLIEQGYKCNVLGKQGSYILMKAISPKGFASTFYFNSKTFLIDKVERVDVTTTGTLLLTELIKEYIEIGGVKLPRIAENVNPLYTIKLVNNYTLNQSLDDSLFLPKE